METLLIVVIVIFLFLGSWRSVIIPVVAIPISLIGGVFLMQIFGFTINLLTLLAIVLSVGLVVDDAIVVVENVERHLREGLNPTNAALLGARELIGPIIAMTITLAAVYVPIGIQGGLTGTLFREFAFTLAGAVTISGVVALATLSPMMSAQLLRASAEEHGFAGKVNHTFDRIRESYGRMLDRTLQVRPAVYVAWIGLSLLAFLLLKFSISMNSELAPTEDQGVTSALLMRPPTRPSNKPLPLPTQRRRISSASRRRISLSSSPSHRAVSAAWCLNPGASERKRRFNFCRRSKKSSLRFLGSRCSR